MTDEITTTTSTTAPAAAAANNEENASETKSQENASKLRQSATYNDIKMDFAKNSSNIRNSSADIEIQEVLDNNNNNINSNNSNQEKPEASSVNPTDDGNAEGNYPLSSTHETTEDSNDNDEMECDEEDDDDDDDEEEDDDDDDDDDDDEDDNIAETGQIRYMESNAPISNSSKTVDASELQNEGLLSTEDYEDYKMLEMFFHYYDNHRQFKETFKDLLHHILENSNIFCWFIIVPECYNKVIKDQLLQPRDTCRRLLSLPSISDTQMEIVEFAKQEIRDTKESVVVTIDKVLARIDSHFGGLSPEINQKYKYVNCMIKALCLKIKADLQRYAAEIELGEKREELGIESNKTYEEAEKNFMKIPGYKKNPYYLSNVLNYAVNIVDIMKDLDKGIEMVNEAFESVFSQMTKRDFNNTFTCSIVELLRNNAHAWALQKIEQDDNSHLQNEEDEDEDDDDDDVEGEESDEKVRDA